MKKMTSIEFAGSRREKILDYHVYEYNFDGPMEGFSSVRESLTYAEENGDEISSYDQMVWTKQRAWDSLDFLVNCYSGGHALENLKQIYPTVVENWSQYAIKSVKFIESDQNSSKAANIPLTDWEFSFANQLICFAMLFGWGKLLKQVSSIVDFNNPRRDGMLERLLAPYVDNRGELPDDCTRHLPYFKTLKILSVPSEARAQFMKEYLGDWYHASKREPYYDSHRRGDQFKGYWAWEAAAITYLLDIDDSSYRDAEFYPADLVAFARSIDAPCSSEAKPEDQELRIKSGQACPTSGTWETLDIPLQQRKFAAGEIMQAENASYGITVWRYVGD